ncbi:hypothetical protein [Novosphingobium resinovorum]|uniref:hypothetical protein n=1 Tax=Novosphingobium resinovorum TaxID=158500 RepID=UPI002ED5C722|nr:hypothetical protein [Novosphingobium resinovorum]
MSKVRNGACSVRRVFFARGEHRTGRYRAQRSHPEMAKTEWEAADLAGHLP